MHRSLPIEFLGGLFCFIAFAALVTFIIYRTLNRKASPGAVPPLRNPQGSRPQRVETRIGKDGFWLRGNRLRRGSKVRYRYFVNDEPMDGMITYDPGVDEQYVYTGHIPAAIEILHIMEAGAQDSSDEPDVPRPEPPIIPSWTNQDHDRGSHTPPASSSIFSGPSAY